MSKLEYSKVSRALWQSKRFNALAESDEKLLYIYLLTCSHQTSAGCYRLPDGYAIADLGWSLADYLARREIVEASGLIAFDAETSEVYIERWLRHSPPTNTKHAQGIRKVIECIDSDELRGKAEADFEDAIAAYRSQNPLGPGGKDLTDTGYFRGQNR